MLEKYVTKFHIFWYPCILIPITLHFPLKTTPLDCITISQFINIDWETTTYCANAAGISRQKHLSVHQKPKGLIPALLSLHVKELYSATSYLMFPLCTICVGVCAYGTFTKIKLQLNNIKVVVSPSKQDFFKINVTPIIIDYKSDSSVDHLFMSHIKSLTGG